MGEWAGLDSRGESLLRGKCLFWRFRRDRPFRSGDNKKAPFRGLVLQLLQATALIGRTISRKIVRVYGGDAPVSQSFLDNFRAIIIFAIFISAIML
jgi:hypothetical protein